MDNNGSNYIYILLFLFVIIIGYYLINKSTYTELTYVKSDVDDNYYLVQNMKDKEQAANLLAQITKNIHVFTQYLSDCCDNNEEFANYKSYVNNLKNNISETKLYENNDNFRSTSYTYNKGTYMVLCLRSKKNKRLHDVNTLMYVVLHELSHVACPEIGHTDLFKDIFTFFTTQAIKINLYNYINFKTNSKEYCGLLITDSIV